MWLSLIAKQQLRLCCISSISSLKSSFIASKGQIKRMEEKEKLPQIHPYFQHRKEHPTFANIRRLTSPVVFV
jgi:hypothetical protein